MYFRMHNWEEWLHVQQMSQFRAGLANFYQVWPVFAHDVSTKESCIFCAELFLQIQRICIDLSSEHIECPQKNTMPTDSDFNSLLIQFTAGLPGKLFSSCKLRRSTNTFASHLHEIQDNKVGKNRHLGYKERTQARFMNSVHMTSYVKSLYNWTFHKHMNHVYLQAIWKLV